MFLRQLHLETKFIKNALPFSALPFSTLPFSALPFSTASERTHISTPSTKSTSLLFTPGPLTTSKTVKEAMLSDYGSRDTTMLETTASIRRRLLTMANTSTDEGYETAIVQGSGSFAIESVLTSVIPSPSNKGKLLILSNGAYGDRMAGMAERAGIDVTVIREDESKPILPRHVEQALANQEHYTHVAVVRK